MTVYVAVSGSHSTGKTTLVKKLYEKFSEVGVSVGIVNEVVRGVCSKEDIGSSDVQRIIYERMYCKLREMDGKYDLVISDRGMIDVLAYVVHNGVMFSWSGDEFLRMREIVSDIVEADRIVFDCYVFCPVENFPLIDDGFRFTDDKLRHMVDVLIYSFLEISGREYCVYRGDVDEVYEFILGVIENENE